jgi:glucokinase
MPANFAIGVDVGATKILAGVVNYRSGIIQNTVKVSSPTDGPDSLMAAIGEAISKALTEAPANTARGVARIGLGLAGQVDREKGVLWAAPNLGGGITSALKVATPLKERFKLPVVLGNDVEAAALGEARFGAGRGKKLFACVFVGTGIGGALMENGRRFRGTSGSAGEIGHTMVLAGGRLCGCGVRGHLEAYASRTAIVAILRERLEAGGHTSLAQLLTQDQRLRSKPIAQAIDEGDVLVIHTIREAGLYLGVGLSSLINLWNPERIVVGGGVIDRIDLLFDVAAETAKQMSLKAPADAVDIVRAQLGDNSGIVGAALL